MSDSETQQPNRRPGGRRVLFVDPPSVIQDQMIHFLVAAQYEAGIVGDPRRVIPVLRKYPRSIVYFNVDSRFPAQALEQVVRGVIDTQESHGAEVGILSYNENREAAQKYLMEYGASGGYITLHLGFEKSARVIVRALEAAEARGERKFVRVKAPVGKASLNINTGQDPVHGEILDLSEAGIACRLRGDYGVGTYFQDIQLRLWGSLAKVSGTIRGNRESPHGRVSVIMLDPISDSTSRGKIYGFIKRVMQHEIDSIV